MKREERNQESINIIINAATAEFGENGYDGASLNVAMEKSQISKGRFYHYFTSKDELYLTCLEDCFSALLEKMKAENFQDEAFALLTHYFSVRLSFFEENPYYHRLFIDAVQQPPVHLREKIIQLKKTVDNFHLEIFRKLLAGISLREEISEEDAVDYFLMVQDAFYHRKGFQVNDMEKNEQRLKKVINILLYGVAEREANNF